MLMKKQKGKCTIFKQYFTRENSLEMDYIISCSKGGGDNMGNKQLIHNYLHHTKTASDLAIDAKKLTRRSRVKGNFHARF